VDPMSKHIRLQASPKFIFLFLRYITMTYVANPQLQSNLNSSPSLHVQLLDHTHKYSEKFKPYNVRRSRILSQIGPPVRTLYISELWSNQEAKKTRSYCAISGMTNCIHFCKKRLLPFFLPERLRFEALDPLIITTRTQGCCRGSVDVCTGGCAYMYVCKFCQKKKYVPRFRVPI
jgi:hypothetical protein